MTKTMTASRSFTGPDGDHQKGQSFEASADRVDFLTEGGYATLAETPALVEPSDDHTTTD